ncbi:MAG: NapC/NirT family cytochrome c [Zoogloeaceae bacterium]|jgi:cytochrome c-type protein NapC|nr:NapC/NirT family cytochrome c [Zoogloeaceae bacterium]
MDANSPVEVSASGQPDTPWKKWKRFLTVPLLVAFALGILFTGFFNVALELTNAETFCLSCHEMKDNVYREYQTTIHYTNRSGVRAVCKDCHVPKEFFPKIVRKLQASNEVLHKILGSIDTPEKFTAKRAQLAQNEWRRMQANDSQECRNCHDAQSFDLSMQGYRSVNQHEDGLAKGQTCIDCHKGIAHQLPKIDQGINLADPPGIAMEVFRPPAPAQSTAAPADDAEQDVADESEDEAEQEAAPPADEAK